MLEDDMSMRLLFPLAVCLVLQDPGTASAQSMDAVDQGRGFNLNLYVTAGQPAVTGDARHVWDSAGGLSMVPGVGLRFGYRWHRIGIEGGFDLVGANPSDRDGLGGGVNLMAVFRVAPEHRFDPTVAIGFVREGMLADFNQGEFPIGLIATNPTGVPPAGTAGTFGNGVRLDVGGGLGLHPNLDLTLDAIADFVWFGTASYDDFEYSLRESGVSFWPRLAIGLRWDP